MSSMVNGLEKASKCIETSYTLDQLKTTRKLIDRLYIVHDIGYYNKEFLERKYKEKLSELSNDIEEDLYG